MIENQNITNYVSVTEKVDGGDGVVMLTEEENTVVVYDLSPEDFDAAVEKAKEVYIDSKGEGTSSGTICSPRVSEVWFKFTIPQSATYSIRTVGQYDTIGKLYSSSGNPIMEVDDNELCGKPNFRMRVDLTEGATYYLRVTIADAQSGICYLTISRRLPVDYVETVPKTIVLDVGKIYQLPYDIEYTNLNIPNVPCVENLKLAVVPAEAEERSVSWYNNAGDIVEIKRSTFNNTVCQIIKGNTPGVGYLYVGDALDNGRWAEVTVIVRNPNDTMVTGINLECTQKTISVGDSAYILSTVYPPDALNKNVVWKSSNQAIAEVDEDGCVTVYGVGTAIITATTVDGGYTATCTVTGDPRPHVVIEKEVEGGHDFFKVTFPESEGGLIWKSVGIDLDDDSVTVNGYPHHWNRNAFNHGQQFNEKQLAFLYLLDPHGVTRYVKNIYTRFDGSTDERIYLACMFKDRLYEKIFGKSPRLLRVFPDNSISYYDTWNPNIEKEARIVFYSDAEVLFGTHKIDDLLSWLGFIANYGIPIVTSLFGTICSTLGKVMTALELCKVVFFAGAINDTLSSGVTSSLEEYLKTFIQNKGDPGIDLDAKDYKGAFSTWFGWVMVFLNATITIIEGLNALQPSVEQVAICDKVNSSVDYRVTLKNGVIDLTMQELVEYCEE